MFGLCEPSPNDGQGIFLPAIDLGLPSISGIALDGGRRRDTVVEKLAPMGLRLFVELLLRKIQATLNLTQQHAELAMWESTFAVARLASGQ